MDVTSVIALSTMIVTLVCGFIAKKIPWFNNNLIPIQNLLIGLIAALIYYFMTKDFSLAVSLSGICAGGTYDLIRNFNKIDWKKIMGGII